MMWDRGCGLEFVGQVRLCHASRLTPHDLHSTFFTNNLTQLIL
jgi:hypothetical protein